MTQSTLENNPGNTGLPTYADFTRLKNKLAKVEGELAKKESQLQNTLHQLALSKKEWETSFASISDLVIITDLNDLVCRCNAAACEKLKLDLDQILGKSIGDLVFGDPSAYIPLMKEAKEVSFPLLNGIFEVSAHPLYLDEEIAGTAFTFKDVTEKKLFESDLLKTQRMASIGTLTAGMAQEINSPLQIITGVCDGLLIQLKQGKFVRERLQKKMEQLSENSWKVAKILRSLLTYLQAAPDQFIPVDFNQLVRDTVFSIQNQITESEHVSFSTFLGANLPVLVCDPAQIIQVIIRIIQRAKEAMAGKEGTIIISTRFMEGEDVIVLRVEDNGSSISQDIQSKIFDPLYSAGADGQVEGVGLANMAAIVRAHGGRIDLASTPGKGSVFSLSFPRRQGNPMQPDQNDENRAA